MLTLNFSPPPFYLFQTAPFSSSTSLSRTLPFLLPFSFALVIRLSIALCLPYAIWGGNSPSTKKELQRNGKEFMIFFSLPHSLSVSHSLSCVLLNSWIHHCFSMQFHILPVCLSFLRYLCAPLSLSLSVIYMSLTVPFSTYSLPHQLGVHPHLQLQ